MAIPLFEIKSSKKPIAIVKGGDRRLHFYKVNRYADKFFATKDALVWELDDRYEYRFLRTSIYIYNFGNSKPLLLSGMQEIDETLKRKGESELFNKNDFAMKLKEAGLSVEQVEMPADLLESMSPVTKRFIQDYAADDERAKTEQMIKVHSPQVKNPIPKYSSELLGMGMNRGDFAFVQTAHKRLDIVPMYMHGHLAYTKYGVFHVSLDNVYYVQKQAVAFFVLNKEEDKILEPLRRPAERYMNALIRKGRWKELDSFIAPHPNKYKLPKVGTAYALVPIKIDPNKIPETVDPKPEKPEQPFDTPTVPAEPQIIPYEEHAIEPEPEEPDIPEPEDYGSDITDEQFAEEEKTEPEQITEELPDIPTPQVNIDDATPPPQRKGSDSVLL